MKTLKVRAITSTLLGLNFLIVTITGVGLKMSPNGRIAKQLHWTFLGMEKIQLEKIHTLTGFLMGAIVLVHLVLNYKMWLNEIKSLRK